MSLLHINLITLRLHCKGLAINPYVHHSHKAPSGQGYVCSMRPTFPGSITTTTSPTRKLSLRNYHFCLSLIRSVISILSSISVLHMSCELLYSSSTRINSTPQLQINQVCLVNWKTKLDLIKNVKIRVAVTKMRISCHLPPIESGRYKKINRVERIWAPCNKSEIDDEFHYLFSCKGYLLGEPILDKE